MRLKNHIIIFSKPKIRTLLSQYTYSLEMLYRHHNSDLSRIFPSIKRLLIWNIWNHNYYSNKWLALPRNSFMTLANNVTLTGLSYHICQMRRLDRSLTLLIYFFFLVCVAPGIVLAHNRCSINIDWMSKLTHKVWATQNTKYF